MSRELKFRIWDKLTESFIYCEDDNQQHFILDLNGNFHNLQNGSGGDEYVVQQYTGLKDKNGKEIYEGDLVNTIYEHDPYNCIGKVIYHDETASYRIKTYKNLLPIVTFRFIEDKPQGLLNVVSEVIGNEFEKPPCNFDHNAECLVCNGWPSDCPFVKLK